LKTRANTHFLAPPSNSNTSNYDYLWDVQDYMNIRIDERFREEGIEIPFRQVDIWMRGKEAG
jgi:small-conductance mechanosensitive channel